MKRHIALTWVLMLLWLAGKATGMEGWPPENRQGGDGFFSSYNPSFITEREGLPCSLVEDLLKDSEGFIWMATHKGLCRYDGYRFLPFTPQAPLPGLKGWCVNRLCEDRFKRLWIASEGGMDLLDLKSLAVADLGLETGHPLEELMNHPVHALCTDRKGNLWAAGEKGLWCIVWDEQGRVDGYYRLEVTGMPPIQAVIDTGKEICAGIGNQVCRISKEGAHGLKSEPLSESLPPFSQDWRIHCMLTDDNLLWIGTNRGLFKYNLENGELKRYRYSTHRPGMLSQAYVTDIQLTGKGHLVVATRNGLNAYDRQRDAFSFIRQADGGGRRMLDCDVINCLLTEGETIWAGTETGGISLLAPKRLDAGRWGPPAATNAVAEDRQGNIYAALLEGGVTKWNTEGEEKAQYRFVPDDISSISNNTLTGMLIDSYNHLWAYTWGVGINEANLNENHAGKFKRHTCDAEPELKGDFTGSACEDRTHRGIWFGTTQGLHFYDKQTGKFRRVPLWKEGNNEFEAVNALLADRKQRLWVGTTQGVYVADLKEFGLTGHIGKCRYLRYKLDQPEGKLVEKINCLLEDRDEGIWLGGDGSGLYHLEGEEGDTLKFSNRDTRHGLAGNSILGMAEDGEGNLWITTHEGVSRLERATMTFTNYTQADGLPDAQYYRNGVHYSARQNRIFLATTEGLTAISVGKLPPGRVETEVRFVPLDTDENTAQTGKLSLHESENRFSVGLTTLDYAYSKRIRFAYRLKGYEQEWNDTGPGDATARYNHVPPGHYTLQAKATDETGHWSEQVAEMKVDIRPYFYKSPAFLLFALLAAGAAACLFYRRKTRKFREQQALLKREVKQRTRELAEQNRQLERMAEHVKEVTEEKIAFFTNITHEFRTPVTLIHGPIAHALQIVKEKEVRRQLEIAERSSRSLLQLVNELLDFRKLDMDKVVLDKKAHNLPAMLDDLLLPFKAFASERHIRINSSCRLPEPCIVMDAAYMRKALVNLMANAVKFTPDQGRIDIYVAAVRDREEERQWLYISVCDTGRGIEPEETEKIFDRFYQSRDNTRQPEYKQSGTGIGLFLCRKIVELHGGEIHARNNHRQGAAFRIVMPLIPGKAEEENGQEKERTEKENTGTHVPKETILIVEDNRDMRTYLSTLLTGKYRLLEAGNGEEALHMVQEQTVDLILSDLMMPGMDGMELSRRVKENLATSHIPLLLLTALRSEAQEKKSLEIGVDEYLCKPFDEEALLLRIRNILAMREKYKRLFATTSRVEELHIKENSRDKAFIDRAMTLMQQNYADPEYTLDRFVRDMGYSKTLVNRKMQDLTGQPIGQFMKACRLNIAQKIIQKNDGSINVSELAYAVGFNDPKYFTKCFKEFFGYLPSSKLKK